MSMGETPAPAPDEDMPRPTTATVVLAGTAASDICPTCGGAPGPGKTGRCLHSCGLAL